MGTASELRIKIAEALRVSQNSGVRPSTVGFGDDAITGWEIQKGKSSYFNSKPDDSDYKSWTTVQGTIVLVPAGELWAVDYCWGVTDERGSFNWTRGGAMSMEGLVGTTGAPFSGIMQILERYIAIRS